VVELGGRGVVYSYAILHHPRSPAFEYPVIAALIELDEGIRILSNITGVEPGQLEIGMPVEAHFAPTAHGLAVPQFRPVPVGAP
jgi:uncharacterized OB-fold protein